MQIFFAIPNVIYPIILAGLGFILVSLQVKKKSHYILSWFRPLMNSHTSRYHYKIYNGNFKQRQHIDLIVLDFIWSSSGK